MTVLTENSKILEALADKRGEDILAIDLRGTSSIADTFILVTGNSDVHMKTLRQAIEDYLDANEARYAIEGQNSTQWCLVDSGNLVIHIFSRKARAFYNLEKTWGDAPSKKYDYHM